MDQELLDELKKINPKSIKNNIFQDLELKAYCFNVHDTDTISVLFKYNNEIIKYNLRLNGLDSPELHSKNEKERKLCLEGTEFLKNMVLNKLIKIKTLKTDKFGRMLCLIYNDNNECINDLLIKKNYCRAYDGGTKQSWDL